MHGMVSRARLSRVRLPYSRAPRACDSQVDHNLYGMGHLRTAKPRFRAPVPPAVPRGTSQHALQRGSQVTAGGSVGASQRRLLWDLGTMPADWLPQGPAVAAPPRHSTCELECDCHSSDVLNQRDLVRRPLEDPESRDRNFVESLLPMWAEERARCDAAASVCSSAPICATVRAIHVAKDPQAILLLCRCGDRDPPPPPPSPPRDPKPLSRITELVRQDFAHLAQQQQQQLPQLGTQQGLFASPPPAGPAAEWGGGALWDGDVDLAAVRSTQQALAAVAPEAEQQVQPPQDLDREVQEILAWIEEHQVSCCLRGSRACPVGFHTMDLVTGAVKWPPPPQEEFFEGSEEGTLAAPAPSQQIQQQSSPAVAAAAPAGSQADPLLELAELVQLTPFHAAPDQAQQQAQQLLDELGTPLGSVGAAAGPALSSQVFGTPLSAGPTPGSAAAAAAGALAGPPRSSQREAAVLRVQQAQLSYVQRSQRRAGAIQRSP